MARYKKRSGKKNKTSFLAVLGIILLIVVILIAGYMIWEQAPDVRPDAPDVKPEKPAIVIKDKGEKTETDIPEDDPGLAPTTDRDEGVYTILFVGSDVSKANTDTIIVGNFDTVNHTLDLVSIPRDTCINQDWDIRKINAVYGGDVFYGGNGIDAMKAQLKRLMGFEVDCYAVIDLDSFVDTIDIMGGVYFEVPMDMDYEDPSQDLYIHLEAGYQLLDGYNAMCCCRFRSGYASGDRGRIETQQKFLRAVADQFLTAGNIPNFGKVIDRLSEGLNTDLSPANIAYFLRQLLLCKKEDIHFYSMPTTGHTIYKYSYAVINLDEWITMINEHLNPYSTPVTAANLDVVYNLNGGFGCTGYMHGEYYYDPEYGQEEENDEDEGSDYEDEPEYDPEPEPIGDLPDPDEEPET